MHECNRETTGIQTTLRRNMSIAIGTIASQSNNNANNADVWIRLLLQAGVIDVNEQTSRGSCLHEAAMFARPDAVRLLLAVSHFIGPAAAAAPKQK